MMECLLLWSRSGKHSLHRCAAKLVPDQHTCLLAPPGPLHTHTHPEKTIPLPRPIPTPAFNPQARLVPMVCGGVAEPPGGGRPVLRGEDGAALLRSLLRPEALLDEGRLDQFASTLKASRRGCRGACAA